MSVLTITERLEPSIPARSIFGTSPQSVQYMNLQSFQKRRDKKRKQSGINLQLSVKTKALSLFCRDDVCGALLCCIRGTYPVKQSKVTLQKAEKKQLKTNPQYYIRLYFHVFLSFLGSSEKVGNIQDISTTIPKFMIKQQRQILQIVIKVQQLL